MDVTTEGPTSGESDSLSEGETSTTIASKGSTLLNPAAMALGSLVLGISAILPPSTDVFSLLAFDPSGPDNGSLTWMFGPRFGVLSIAIVLGVLAWRRADASDVRTLRLAGAGVIVAVVLLAAAGAQYGRAFHSVAKYKQEQLSQLSGDSGSLPPPVDQSSAGFCPDGTTPDPVDGSC